VGIHVFYDISHYQRQSIYPVGLFYQYYEQVVVDNDRLLA